MPDWHPGVWQTNQELVNSALWIKNWVGLVNDMINLPNTAGKLILDLLNVSLGMYVWKRVDPPTTKWYLLAAGRLTATR